MSTGNPPFRTERFASRLKQRRRAELRFRFYGQFAIGFAATLLVILLMSIGLQAWSAFSRYELQVSVAPTSSTTRSIAYDIRNNLYRAFPDAPFDRATSKEIRGLVSTLAAKSIRKSGSTELGQRMVFVPLSDHIDRYLKGKATETQTFYIPFRETDSIHADIPDEVAARVGESLRRSGFLSLSEENPETLTLNRETASLLLTGTDGTYRVTDLRSGEAKLELLLKWDVPDGLNGKLLLIQTPETRRAVSDIEIAATEALRDASRVRRAFNSALILSSDSSEPELAGVLAALVGSVLIVLVTMAFAIPVGVAAAIYLEEFAPRTWVNRFITATINNLAAVPTIVFGLLGAAFFINGIDFQLPFLETSFQLGGGMGRGWPVVGGLVLGLIALPTIIVASRSAISAVPARAREAAIGLGASKVQSVTHHVLPEAAPGILTGAIIALAQALGEAAPLLLIGMFAFVGDPPSGVNDRSSALPVLIFQWSTRPEQAWEANTAAAVVILLFLMIAMNALAIWIRMKLSRHVQ